MRAALTAAPVRHAGANYYTQNSFQMHGEFHRSRGIAHTARPVSPDTQTMVGDKMVMMILSRLFKMVCFSSEDVIKRVVSK